MKLNGFIIYFFMSLYSSSLVAQVEIDKLWTAFTVNIKHNNYRFQLESQLRAQDAPNTFEQFLNGIGLGYPILPSLTVWGGANYLLIGSPQSNVPTRTEYRFWQQAIFSQKIQQHDLQLRVRLEERRRENFSELNYRLRNRLAVTKPFYKSSNWIVSDEIFTNLNKPAWVSSKTIDQNRFLIALSQDASDLLTLGIGYLNQLTFNKEPVIGHIAYLFAQVEIDN